MPWDRVLVKSHFLCALTRNERPPATNRVARRSQGPGNRKSFCRFEDLFEGTNFTIDMPAYDSDSGPPGVQLPVLSTGARYPGTETVGANSTNFALRITSLPVPWSGLIPGRALGRSPSPSHRRAGGPRPDDSDSLAGMAGPGIAADSESGRPATDHHRVGL